MIESNRQPRGLAVLVTGVMQMLATVDWLLLAATAFLLFIGLTTLQNQGSTFFQKQSDYLIVGVVTALTFWRISYRFWTSKFVLPVIYAVNIGLLVAVMVAGHSAMGAQRWLALGPITLQPSEIAKLVVIFTLAAWLSFRPIRGFRDLFLTMAIIVIPAVLVFKQPDLGTSLTFGAVFFGMTFWAGAGIFDLIALASPLGSLVFNAVNQDWWLAYIMGIGGFLAVFWRRKSWNIWTRLFMVSLVVLLNFGAGEVRPYLWGILKPYQQKRLTSFVNPYADPRGSGYHILQSLIAIGSGGVSGQGLGKGNQSQGQFIPEKHTDFIFAVIGEELGFKIAAGIVVAYTVICLRAIAIAYQCRHEPKGSLIAIGIMCMFLFHVFLNIGMTIGIMPVAGVPLPFLSYGGTALIIDLAAIGLLLSVRTTNPPPRKDLWWDKEQ